MGTLSLSLLYLSHTNTHTHTDAYTLKKTIIPIKATSGYRPDGQCTLVMFLFHLTAGLSLFSIHSLLILVLTARSLFFPTGWLGALLGAKLYFDFSNETSFDDKIGELLNEVKRHVSSASESSGGKVGGGASSSSSPAASSQEVDKLRSQLRAATTKISELEASLKSELAVFRLLCNACGMSIFF